MTDNRNRWIPAALGIGALLSLALYWGIDIAAQGNQSLFIQNNGDVGVGTDTPNEKLHAFEDANQNTFILVENSNTGTSAAGVLRAQSNTASVNFQAHGDGRTISRFGETLAGWAEFLQVQGDGLIIGTVSSRPLILGTNRNNVLELTPTGEVLFQGVTVHADYVFEPEYDLPTIEENADFMWTNRHLEAIGPAQTTEEGREVISLGSDRRGIVEELEKAHIYIAQLNERLLEKEKQLEELQRAVQALQEQN